MSILETSYTAFTLQPFYRNIGKRLTKTPKVYFYDVGLVCYLLGIENAQQLAHHPLRGAVFENMVVCEFLKDCYNHARKNNLSFYRDKSHEVDLIQEDAQGVRAYEIKSAERFHPDFNRALKYLQSLLRSNLSSSQVVYAGQEQLLLPFCGLINYKSKFSDISK